MARTSRDKEYGNEQTPAQRKWAMEREREQADYTRWKCNWVRVWRACPKTRCRRHRGCHGEPHACWELHWNAMPEHFKERIRVTMMAMARRMPPADAQRYVEEELARRRDLMRGPFGPQAVEATAPAPSAVVPGDTAAAPVTPREPDGPRLRRL